MASQALYRKWRSQTFAQVMGQEHVTRTLLNELETGRIAHAYLFCGPRGTGKTSTARILAKALNCRQNGKGEPCNECPMCVSTTQGRALDLIEIDAASNRGIDEIRDLREKVNFAPNEARFKVYIIDEVHMLTDAAFNALLKTLEEPPAHTVFVLATTEPHKVPTTIFSRCQRFDFRRIPVFEAVQRLTHISTEEGIVIEPAALEMIAKSATGSLRDAENLLDQVYAFYGNPINTSQVMTLLGLTGDARVEQVVEGLLLKDTASALTTINAVSNDGLDLRQFNREIIDYLRNALYLKLNLSGLVELPEDRVNRIKGLVQTVDVERLHGLIKVFSQIDFRQEGNATLQLELAVVETVLDRHRAEPVSEPARAVSPPKSSQTVVETQKRNENVRPPSAETAAVSPPEERETPSIVSQTVPAEEVKIDETPGRSVPDAGKMLWTKIIDILNSQPPFKNLAAAFRDLCEPDFDEPMTLKIRFTFPSHMTLAEKPDMRKGIEEAVQKVTGEKYRLLFESLPTDKDSRAKRARQDKDTKIKESVADPLVKAALDMGGKIVDLQ